MNSEELFLEKVMIDVRSFVYILDNCTDKKKVLLFPPINNFLRFLIHQIVEKVFCEANLKTLSFGKFNGRRTIVYHNSINKNIAPSHQSTSPLVKIQGLESRTMSSKVSEARTKKSRKPDIQIYVPRGRRMHQTSHDSPGHQNQWTEEVETCHRNCPVIDLIATENLDTKTKEDNFAICLSDTSEKETTYPRGSGLDTSSTSATENRDVSSEKYDLSSFKTEKCDEDSDIFVKPALNVENLVLHSSDLKSNSQIDVENLIKPCYTKSAMLSCDTLNNQIIDLTSNDSDNRIPTNSDYSPKNTETARTSNYEVKQSEDDALPLASIARETIGAAYPKSESKKNDLMNSSASSSIEEMPLKSKSNSFKTNKGFLKTSECDWEELFDDSGDYVDESLIDELLKTVGKVRIQHTEQDYTPFQTVEERTTNGESIIEVHNFPADFKTDDLLTVFASYRTDQGFQIVWVDDTHALAVFSSAVLADEVLNQELPFVKTRPLKNAIPKSRVKARNYVAAPVTRPKTCVSLARRLVSGHLGMKISITDKQREAEKKLLSDAREKKRQIAKQKNDVWEDTSGDGK